MVNKDCYDRWDKIFNSDAVLCHIGRMATFRGEQYFHISVLCFENAIKIRKEIFINVIIELSHRIYIKLYKYCNVRNIKCCDIVNFDFLSAIVSPKNVIKWQLSRYL